MIVCRLYHSQHLSRQKQSKHSLRITLRRYRRIPLEILANNSDNPLGQQLMVPRGPNPLEQVSSARWVEALV